MVFLPMLAGDDRPSAAAEAERLRDPRATCFWDGERASGVAFAARDAVALVPAALAALPPDDPLRARLEAWLAAPEPMWDVAYLHRPGARWTDEGPPPPDAWTKQALYEVDERGDGHGLFLRARGGEADAAWSSWGAELDAGLAAVGAE